MKKVTAAAAVIILAGVAVFAGITWNARNRAQDSVESFNAAVREYNEKIIPYNEAVSRIRAENEALQSHIDAAQDILNTGEEAYEPETGSELKKILKETEVCLVDIPESLDEQTERQFSESLQKSVLDAERQEAEKGLETVIAATAAIPPVPEVPDYQEETAALEEARKNYVRSVQMLKNVTAPEDSFISDCLRGIETVTAVEAVTTERDPNGLLGKPGGYIGCVYFMDERVDTDLLPAEIYRDKAEAGADDEDQEDEDKAGNGSGDEDPEDSGASEGGTAENAEEDSAEGPENIMDVITAGTAGGGAVEIFKTPEEAAKREEQLSFFHGSVMEPGAHTAEGTLVLRASRFLTEEEQQALLEKVRKTILEAE